MKFAGWGDPGKIYDLSARPYFWDFVRRETGVEDRLIAPLVPPEQILVPEPRIERAFRDAMMARLGPERFSLDPQVRLRHAFGKSYRDLLRARAGRVERVPDAVLFPESREEVEAILATASAQGVAVVPFGGGTNIAGGVESDPAREGMSVTVSLRRMNRILAVDPVARTARIQAGVLGPELEAALNAQGFSLGHFPDSFEYSTLGGWLATRSAGMQSDAYGKIEDMAVSLTLCTPSGTLVTPNVPRSATGPDLAQVAIGSEGTLGIITDAVMRIHPIGRREYRGLLVPGFENGIALARELAHAGGGPTTTRISNPQETALSFALKPRAQGVSAWVARGMKAYLRHVKRFPFADGCLMIIGFESTSEAEIGNRRRRTLAIARRFGAVSLGKGVGAKWYAGRYDYPYLRDVVMDRGGMADVTETAATWSQLPALYQEVNTALHARLQRGVHPGYVGCHLSHSYPAGACLYFTFAAAQEPGNELRQYLETKRLIFEILLRHGATPTHHHAAGYELLPWMRRHLGETGVRLLHGLKQAVDPRNVCNPGKLIPGDTPALEGYWPAEILRQNNLPTE
jgi:alkyldihydroxyacetonephosphate synthase